MVRDYVWDDPVGRLSPDKQKMYDHLLEVHQLLWLPKGKMAGLWSLSKFHPPRSEQEEKK